jgi:hypothetical protein
MVFRERWMWATTAGTNRNSSISQRLVAALKRTLNIDRHENQEYDLMPLAKRLSTPISCLITHRLAYIILTSIGQCALFAYS